MKVLVCGGAGYIGSHMVHELVRAGGYDVTVMDNLSKGHTESIPKTVAFQQGDIRSRDDLERVFSVFQPDAVFVSLLISISVLQLKLARASRIH
jgi:UDP-glucose 4-epimerase